MSHLYRVFNLPVIHLTSGSKEGEGKGALVSRRSAQMGVLYKKFCQNDDGDESEEIGIKKLN